MPNTLISPPRLSSADTIAKAGRDIREHSKQLLRSLLLVLPVDDALDVIGESVVDSNDHAIAVARLRGDLMKPEIDAASGISISTAEAAGRLGLSDETVRQKIKKGQLVGYCPLNDKTKFRLPLWQFSSAISVFAWIPDLIAAYGANGWALMNFLTVPRDSLHGDNYLHYLVTDRVDEVLAAAERSNPD